MFEILKSVVSVGVYFLLFNTFLIVVLVLIEGYDSLMLFCARIVSWLTTSIGVLLIAGSPLYAAGSNNYTHTMTTILLVSVYFVWAGAFLRVKINEKTSIIETKKTVANFFNKHR